MKRISRLSAASAFLTFLCFTGLSGAESSTPANPLDLVFVFFIYRFDSNICQLPMDPSLDETEFNVMRHWPNAYLKGMQKGQMVVAKSLVGIGKVKGINPLEIYCTAAKTGHEFYWQIIEKVSSKLN